MKKLTFVFVAFVLLLTVSFVDKDATPGVGLSPGSKFPQIEVSDSVHGSFDLEKQEGKYVLLSFWASYDAPSRMSNIRLMHAADGLGRADVEFISVSFDRSAAIFEETVGIDGFLSSHYFDRLGTDSEIYRVARLKGGFGNYLLDPRGVIVAKNIDPKSLKDLINL